MKKTEVLKELKSLGTSQNRKVYGRHGVTGEMYGVSYANLNKLQKRIKNDQTLAEQLWATGNHDARILATMVADPASIKASTIDGWAKNLDNYVVTDAFSSVVKKSPLARKRMDKWIRSRDEWIGSAGWNILAGLAMGDSDLSDFEFEAYLKTIEEKIHSSKNRVRYSMNNALIAIGIRGPKLQKLAIAAAKRIGKVEVDHGQTSCKTPDAVTYIPKAASHARRKVR